MSISICLILAQDYKGGNVSSDISGLEPAFHTTKPNFCDQLKRCRGNLHSSPLVLL